VHRSKAFLGIEEEQRQCWICGTFCHPVVAVVIVAVAHVRKLAGQVANLKWQEAQPGCRDTLPISNNPMVHLELGYDKGKRMYEQFQIGREAE
jgi:hypothetical protein